MTCENTLQNIGASKCKKLPQMIKGIITTPENFSITAVAAATLAGWQTPILAASAERIYLWPKWAVGFENISSEEVREESPLASIPVFPGQYRLKLHFRENLQLHKAMFSHNGNAGRCFLIDHELKIIGTSADGGTTLQGFQLDDLNVGNLMLNDGSASTKTPVSVYMTDSVELNQNGFMVDGSSFLNALQPLTTVDLAIVGTPTSSLVKVSVKSSIDEVPILGLVVGDWSLLTGAGAAQTITGVTEPADDGVYHLAGTGLVTGTVNLKAASLLTIKGYESSGSVAVTIV